jgi:hypothetical protein
LRLSALVNRFVFTILCSVAVPDSICWAHSTNTVQVEPSASLPVLVFQTGGQAVQDRTRIPGSLAFLTPKPGRVAAFTPSDDTGKAEISVRGNSSYHYSKRVIGSNYRMRMATTERLRCLGCPQIRTGCSMRRSRIGHSRATSWATNYGRPRDVTLCVGILWRFLSLRIPASKSCKFQTWTALTPAFSPRRGKMARRSRPRHPSSLPEKFRVSSTPFQSRIPLLRRCISPMRTTACTATIIFPHPVASLQIVTMVGHR